MDITTSKPVALISIKPNFVVSIVNGDKRVEFRKNRFVQQVDHVIVYSSKPEQKVVGYFKVLNIDEDEPTSLWKKYKNISGLTFDEFNKYYLKRDIGIAIVMESYFALMKPIPLNKLRSGLFPPQNYLYLSNRELQKLQQHVR